MDDGGTWIFNDKKLDLSLQLVEKGFDVWMTNSRGIIFSNQHVKYNADQKEFWTSLSMKWESMMFLPISTIFLSEMEQKK